jgi:hypothetical protein
MITIGGDQFDIHLHSVNLEHNRLHVMANPKTRAAP